VRRFFRRLFIATAIAFLPLALGVRYLVAIEPWASLAGLVIVTLGTWGLRGRIELAVDDRPISRARRSFERAYFVFWCAAVGSAPLFVIAGPLAWLLSGHIGLGGGLAFLIALPLALWGVLLRPQRVVVRTVEVTVPGLGPAFEGFRIAHLSDIHIGGLFPATAARKVVHMTNRLGADLVALTGDYVTSGNRFHEETGRLLGELEGREGVVAVFGNHDNFGNREPLASTLVASGVTVLENEHFRIERDGEALLIAGVDDIYSRRADVRRTFENVEPSEPSITLVHDPRLAARIAERTNGLILAGHTHWGQIGVPWRSQKLNVAGKRFHAHGGLSTVGDAQLYVHPGIGATGVPVRFGVAPEVTLLVLRRGPTVVVSPRREAA
jgi:uncharacterized protein